MRKTLIPRLNLMELSCIWIFCIWITFYVSFFFRKEHFSFLWRRLWSVAEEDAEKNHWVKPWNFWPFFSHGTFCTFSTFVKTVFLTIKNLKLASLPLFNFPFAFFRHFFFPDQVCEGKWTKEERGSSLPVHKMQRVVRLKSCSNFRSVTLLLDERNSIPSFPRPSHFSLASQFSSSPSFDSCRLIQESTLPSSLLVRPSSDTILIPYSKFCVCGSWQQEELPILILLSGRKECEESRRGVMKTSECCESGDERRELGPKWMNRSAPSFYSIPCLSSSRISSLIHSLILIHETILFSLTHLGFYSSCIASTSNFEKFSLLHIKKVISVLKISHYLKCFKL